MLATYVNHCARKPSSSINSQMAARGCLGPTHLKPHLLAIFLTITSVVVATSQVRVATEQPFEAQSCAMQFAAVRRIPHASLHVSEPTWWLTSRFHFSFADYWNEKRMNFGALRVVNDDLVKGHAGFGTHPHRDAEIFSYVLEGQLSHQDSMGNKESLSRGAVQYLSAGSGITHSEMNDHKETCRFIQVWINPDARGHAPQYGSSRYQAQDRHNKLLHVLKGTGAAPEWPGLHSLDSIALHQDVNVVVSENDAGVKHELQLGEKRQAYLLCMEGQLKVNGDVVLEMRDAAELVGLDGSSSQLVLQAGEQGAHFMVIEMKKA